LPPALVAGKDDQALDLVASKLPFELIPEVIDALNRRFRGELVVGVAESDLTLGLCRVRLDLP
jgi:hypothetical protein